MGRALRRAGVLTGLAAAGWLLGAAAAGADEIPGPGLDPVAEVAAEAGGTSGESGESGESGPAASEAPVLASVAESDGVAEAADAAEAGTRGVVETTAQGTGEVVTGTVRAGREVGGFADGSLSESELAGAVSDGIGGDAGRLQDHLEQTVDQGRQAGLDDVAGEFGPPQNGAATGEPGRDGEAARQQSAPAEGAASAADSGVPAQRSEAEALAAAAPADPASGGPDQSAGSADVPDPLTGSALSDTSDSTGTVSPSPVPAAPTGFETNRANALRLVGQRVALPEDPAVVVRYTADDPSFSPD
ncbi:hypothetical protein [Streptomonospora salina]|uniref:Uncharacterized protein n=1 Tax=Streptomonospora salina TaxID=104205 RepID=A0A841E5H5_9ACTN|nr:hypothetical protein [Streptomonospora salina]MBB5998042.1 hypothetical protein [Streptomonospora salina]